MQAKGCKVPHAVLSASDTGNGVSHSLKQSDPLSRS